jgi:hypothetical protein
MKLAWMLRGRVIESGSGAESIYVPSFPSQCVGFNVFFTGRSDVALVLWEFIQCIVQLMAKCLCRSALSQGISFCSKQGLPVAIDQWKWDWIVNTIKGFFAGSVGSVAVHEFKRKKKRISLRSGGQVHASPEPIVQKWMRFETSDQLVALKYLLGSFCLFGVREIPRQGTSLVVQNASLCNIIPRVQVAVEGGFIRRTSRYGVDFGYDGNAFKVVVRYCMRKGDSAALREFRQLATNNGLSQQHGVQASELELLRVEVNTFFKNDDGNLLIVQEVQDNRCLCKSVRSPEFFTLPIENVRVMAHRYRSGLLGGIN